MSLRMSLFAATYDSMSRSSNEAGLREIRHGLLAGATGSVLEVGAGTGLNLPHYDGKVESLVFTDPEPAMLRRLQKKVREQAPLAKVLRAPAEDLPFEDDTFDTVVSTLVLCGVDDQARSLREIRRVLRPGGRLLFLEHVRSDEPALARFQDRMNWLNRLVVFCDCNRPTLSTIEASGFRASELERSVLPKAPKFARPLIYGSAV
ncbi:MAG TPA: class I SAM-dependent methyltransferase [Gaiellaceae bacterium]|nr:class I SAM-dependent methyltransferase [Gaiellaceae bacterium]